MSEHNCGEHSCGEHNSSSSFILIIRSHFGSRSRSIAGKSDMEPARSPDITLPAVDHAVLETQFNLILHHVKQQEEWSQERTRTSDWFAQASEHVKEWQSMKHEWESLRAEFSQVISD